VLAIAASSARIYAGGDFASVNGVRRDNLAALDRSTGAVDAGWRVDVTGTGNTVADLALDGAGRLYVAGYFGALGGAPTANLGSVDAASGIVYKWNPQADGGVRSIAFAGGKVVVCGWFAHVGGATGQVAALDPTTATAAWALPADDDVFKLAALGNTVYVAGEYANIGGAPRSSLAAVDATTGGLLSWAPKADRSVWAIAATPQRVYFGGTFDSVDTIPRHEVAAVDSATGVVDSAWVAPGNNSTVFSLASDGSRVFVGGDFSRMGREVNELVELDAATGAPTSWTPTPDFTVRDIYLDGDILVGGDIDNYSRLQEGFAVFGAATDATAPETTITTSPPATTSNRDATFTFASSESGSTFWCAVDDATPYGSCSSPMSFVGFGFGTHTFHVYATDAAGNADLTPVSYSWTVSAPSDTSPPDTSVTSGPAATTTRTDATFTFGSSEPSSTFACSLDGAGWSPCTSPQTYAGLSVGSHSFSVRATDASGNTDPTPAAWSWQVLPPAPANDMFAAAETIPGGSGSLTGTTVSATKEPGEPSHAGNAGGHSVWYRWRAPTRAFVTFSTAGSDFDTLLAVYEGSTVSALSAVASNDDATSGSRTSSVRFRTRAGVTYSIAVDGKNGALGPLTLSWSP
jgi:hypothetical protein